MHPPAFLVDGEERRRIRRVLPEIAAQSENLARRGAVAAKKNKAAELIFRADQAFVAPQGFAAAASHDHLPHLCTQRFHHEHYTTALRAERGRVVEAEKLRRAEE